ncbi:hypothetical protein JRQ81_018716 [Phrynocephalus forsythii]|uniref:Uncharacterized protein n=1 Tax=Phrynocephalus forsythii TaxID=171643 RepID=A0A9Q1AZN1_9SAUR|nr:hypothetical protein JRQ81_018716 [Phrynocephalus forsythii]
MGGWPETQVPGRRRVGSGSLPVRVKIEASEEELCGHRPGSTGKEGPGPPVAQAANTEGGGTAMAPPRKDGRLPAAVKTERMSCSPPLWHPDGPRNALACLGATDQQRLPDEAAVLGVRIKREPEAKEEELPLRGLKGSSEEGEEEEEEDEEGSLPCSLPHRGSSCSSVESRVELGLWVPYSEEWSPATSPLHGLLNCLKEIPTPKQPRASKTGPERRGGGGGEMRKGGRNRRLELHREWAVPEKMGALSSQSHTLPVPNTCGPAREDLPSRGTRERPDPQLLPWPAGPASSNRGRDAAELQKSRPQVTRGGTPLESLVRCLKGLPLNAPSHPCSPAVSSSLGSSPERLLSGTPKRGRRARKGDGLGRESSTPLQGLEKCLQELPLGSPIQTPSPVVSSSFGSSPDRCHRWTPEAGRWARKEQGGGSGSTPLQGLERCLKEVPLGSPGHPPLSPALRASFGSFPDGRHRWTPEAGRWARNEGGAVSSGIPPLQGLENCLKEIALSRNPLSHSASSSCTQRLREGEGRLQGPQARGGPAGSPLQRLPVVGPSGSTGSGARAESSPLRRLMTCLEGVPIQRPSYLDTPSASSSSSSPSSSSSSSSSCSETEREQEGPRSGACSNCSQEDAWSTPRSQEDAPAAAAATTPACAQSCSDTSAQAPLGRTSERDAKWSCLEGRVQCSHAEAKQKLATRNRCPQSVTHSLGETPAGPLKAGSTRTDSAPKEWDAHRGTSSVEGGGTSESSPLRGLLRCLKEITARGPSPGSLSAGRSPAAEGRCQQARKEEAATRASGEGPAPTSPADGVQGSSPEGNRCLPLSNGSPPTPTSCARRPSEPQAQRSGVKRSFPTARNEDGPPSGTRPCSTGSQGKEDPGTPSKKKCPSPGLPSPRHSCGSGKSLESKAEQGDVGPVLSRKLDRLSADMSAICRDVAQLQSHLDRLEQEARGWGLELATLRMENRSLSEYVRRMEGRCRSLENRSRRNNLRMLGLPEGAEGSDPLSFLQRTLPEMLALPAESRPLEVESARRVHGGVAWDPNGRPRPLVFRLLRFADKAAILQAAQARHLSYAGTQVTILPDFCSSLSQRRRFPVRAFRRTRWLADLCFGPRHASFCRPWVQGWREPALATSRPLADEREGRAPKGPEDRNWDADPSAGSGHCRGCLSPGSCEQHNP